jgi:SRSO17 transposase
MDHYEVRTWTAWHRFVTLCMVAHALLVVLRAQVVIPVREVKKGIRRMCSYR